MARVRTRSLGDELREIGRRCAALPDLDKRSAEEILGFDEVEVPR
jgi:antitoxin VapB